MSHYSTCASFMIPLDSIELYGRDPSVAELTLRVRTRATHVRLNNFINLIFHKHRTHTGTVHFYSDSDTLLAGEVGAQSGRARLPIAHVSRYGASMAAGDRRSVQGKP